MPSRFEPCGLNQMYSLKYGTVPVVRETGGLADTITDAHPETLAAGTANGFSFREDNAQALGETLRRACDAYRQADVWSKIQAVGMRQDWSWRRSAQHYAELYQLAAALRGKPASAVDPGKSAFQKEKRSRKRGAVLHVVCASRERSPSAAVRRPAACRQGEPCTTSRWPLSGTSTSPTTRTTVGAKTPCRGFASTAPATTGAWPRCSRDAPEISATINLVPSLLVQLAAYTERGHEDTHLRVSRVPADSLGEQDLHFLLDNFFMVQPDHNIRPYPRYQELYQKRGVGVDPPERARKRFSKRDLLDLQVWSNLTWIHPLAFEHHPDLAEFRAKGRHWTEKEKLWFLDKQRELLAEIVPLHRHLLERGQIELTTTPYYHPILPLLSDKRLARRAMPDVVLPESLEGYPEDLREHVRRAVELHEKTFGQKPRGMWPSEGSVCQSLVPILADAGIQWIATDEEILSCSTEGWVSRDANGYLRNPEMLYRPWRVEEAGRSLQIVFRDHAMSDQIGFHYQRYDAAPGRRRLHRQTRSHWPRDLLQRRPPTHDGQHHPRRRELLGVLPPKRRRLPPQPLPPHRRTPPHQARPRLRLPRARIPPPTSSDNSSPAVGSSTTSASGSATPSATAPGTSCTRRAATSSKTPPATPPTNSAAPGKNSSSPKAATGSGGSAIRTSAPRRDSSTASSANTCKTSIPASASSPPPNSPAPSATASATDCTPSPRAS